MESLGRPENFLILSVAPSGLSILVFMQERFVQLKITMHSRFLAYSIIYIEGNLVPEFNEFFSLCFLKSTEK